VVVTAALAQRTVGAIAHSCRAEGSGREIGAVNATRPPWNHPLPTNHPLPDGHPLPVLPADGGRRAGSTIASWEALSGRLAKYHARPGDARQGVLDGGATSQRFPLRFSAGSRKRGIAR
jgi:hypothetical protein